MFLLSAEHNENYIGRIAKLDKPIKHDNADKLQKFRVNHQQVVTNLEYKEGDLVAFFPVGSCINKELISFIDGFEDPTLNKNTTVKGYFNKHGRVRAIRLRGEQVEGFILPISIILDFLQIALPPTEGTLFDSYGDKILVEKYVPPRTRGGGANLGKSDKKDERALKHRMVEGQFKFHVKTPNLKNTVGSLLSAPNKDISITYKMHGTSAIFSNVLIKRNLSKFERVLKFFGYKVPEVEYSPLYASRQVIKGTATEELSKEGFYNTNVWKNTFNKLMLESLLPQGFTIYGEICGYTATGECIQKGYDYNIPYGQDKLFVYRITHTSPDGFVVELSMQQIIEFCSKYNLLTVPILYLGTLRQFMEDYEIKDDKDFISTVSTLYRIEENCYLCKNKVPAEGVVIKVEDLSECIVHKLKSFNFTQEESKEDEVNIEDLN